MTLKRKIAINISFAFSALYGISALLIYISFSTFRKTEFMNRLEEKALTTTKLLLNLNELDKQRLDIFDQNSINRLYNEKTLVFDEHFKLIYSSIDAASVKWNIADLKRLRKVKKTFVSVGEKDKLGIFFDNKDDDYYVLIGAEDKYGHSQLDFLLRVLIISFFVLMLVVWFSTYAFVRKQLKPLDDFEEDITTISANRLNSKLPESRNDDEINLLAKAFNAMMSRIDASFNAQKEFTANASHELRTPITRLTLQLENLIQKGGHSREALDYLNSMQNDLNQLADLIHSLLLLARSNEDVSAQFRRERIDEIIFDAYEKTKKNFPDFQVNFEIEGESDLEVNGVKSLLEIVFINLLRNAFLYSADQKASVKLSEQSGKLTIKISNTGENLDALEQARLFEPFVRGNNASLVQGSGLGLRIAERILSYHAASIAYSSVEKTHVFTITFSTLPN